MDEDTITWTAPEYTLRKKNKEWFTILWIVVVAAALVAFLLKNILFMIFLIVSGVILTSYANRSPGEHTYTLSSQGIQINDTLHPFSSLSAFWIDQESPALHVLSVRSYIPPMVIPLAHINPDEVETLLSPHLHTVEPTTSVVDRIMRTVGF